MTHEKTDEQLTSTGLWATCEHGNPTRRAVSVVIISIRSEGNLDVKLMAISSL